ncbi:CAP domain-containing protein [Shouchella clausii]
MLKRSALLMVLLAILAVLVYEQQNQMAPAPDASIGQMAAEKREAGNGGKDIAPTSRFDTEEELDDVDEETDEDKGESDAKTEQASASLVNVSALMGKQEKDVIATYGDPVRKDPSAFGYESWVYTNVDDGYLVVCVEHGEVVSIVASGSAAAGFLGNERASFSELEKTYSFEENVPVETDDGQFTFRLTGEDYKMRPLAPVDDYWLQVYMDIHTDEVSSIRLMTDEVLLKQKPYSLSYTGTLPERPELSEEQMKRVEAANEQQIFERTNHIRAYHGLSSFEWSEEVADVAYLHSKDMHDEQYFDHVSPVKGNLADRFNAGEVPFAMAGENIALKYVDGIAATEGWLNSEGHRVNLLHEEFTFLGVGVYEDYYTQNFLKPQS